MFAARDRRSRLGCVPLSGLAFAALRGWRGCEAAELARARASPRFGLADRDSLGASALHRLRGLDLSCEVLRCTRFARRSRLARLAADDRRQEDDGGSLHAISVS